MVKRHRIKPHSQAWHDFRKRGIGGSEVASVMATASKSLGELVYTPPIKLHLLKIGEPIQEFTGNQQSEAGKYQESKIIDLYRHHDLTNPSGIDTYRRINSGAKPLRRVVQPKAYYTNDKYPHLFSSPDAIDYGTDWRPNSKAPMLAIVEAKLTNSMEANRYAMRVSPSFILQCYQNMMVLELSHARLCILIDGLFFEVITLEANKEVFEQIEYTTAKFWQNVLQARVIKEEYGIEMYYSVNPESLTERQREGVALLSELEPEFLGTDKEVDFIKQMIIPTPEETVMIGTDEQHKHCVEYLKTGKAINELESKKTLHQVELIKSLQGTHIARFGDEKGPYFSYKPNKSGKAIIYVSPKFLKEEE